MAHQHQADHTRDPGAITGSMRELRARLRARLVVTRACLLGAAVLAVALILAVADYVLRLPEWIRWIHWGLGIAAIVWIVWRYVRPAWRFSPSLTDLALRVERKRPELRGLLASAVDFTRSGDASRSTKPRDGTPSLAEALAGEVRRQAERSWRAAPLVGLIRSRTLARSTFALAAAIIAVAAMNVASPSLWTIGALRLAAPWSGASWPKRTGILDLTEGDVHARGTALPLRAAVIKSNRPWESTYAAVRYRLVIAGETSADRRDLLTWQRRNAETDSGEPGALFERLIEPAADAVEFRFETEDDATPWRRMQLVPPPAVVDARAVITPPEYARRLAGASGDPAEPVTVNLGPGTDDRAVAPASLAGSDISLTITLNKPVELPEAVAEIFVDPEAPIDTPGRARILRRGTTWTINWTLTESLRLPIRLRDEHDIESTDEAVFRFEALADRPAAATITEPGSDLTVLPTALVPVTAEGRDDVGLAWIALEHAAWTPAGQDGARSGPGGALEQRGQPTEAARADAEGLTLARASTELDLATLDLKPGDELRLVALAIDARGVESEGVAPTRSAPRTLRIISEQQFVEEIQRTLTEVRQAAIRTDEQQAALLEQTRTGRTDSNLRRAQGAVTDRLNRQSDIVARLSDRVRENRVDDRGLEELLARARDTINDAGQASSRAAESLEKASSTDDHEAAPSDSTPSGRERGEATSQSPDSQTTDPAPAGSDEQSPSNPPAGQSGEESPAAKTSPSPPGQPNEQASAPPSDRPITPELRDAAQAQQDVQDHLRNLIELLDRGEDNWLARNTIERLAREQRELRQSTQQAGQSTAGKRPDQLDAAERSELDRIVEKQSSLADQTAELARDLRQREQALREKDPAAAQGMAQAARRAEQSQVAQTMKNAAEEARQNQTARASRQQQQAEQSLEEMLEDLNRVDKARDEVLRRELASIIETLEALVLRQQEEIEALDDNTRNRRGLEGLDEGMIQVNRNTLGALDQAKAAGPEAAPIATLVSRAADAQTGAITEIRRPIVGATMVRELEERSLAHLKQALDKAKQIDQAAADRERRKKLAELKKAYRELLEREVAIRSETDPLAAAAELSRRDRQIARALAERQDGVGADLKALLTRTSELQAARVFDYAHVRMDALSRSSSAALTEARIPEAQDAQATLITLLKNVIESLNDPRPDEQKFSEGAQGGGAGGGQSGEQPLIPPLKELILLRQMQTDLAAQTVELSRAEGDPPAPAIADLARSQRELMNVGREFVDRIKQSEPSAPQPIEPAKPDAPPPIPDPANPEEPPHHEP